jgi:hypothetical protein
MTVQEYLGKKIIYDPHGPMIFTVRDTGHNQHLLDVRGWGSIQYLFKKDNGDLDLDRAAKLQDEIGIFIAKAIQEKIERDFKCST